jgi:hypothetical protein
VRRPFLPSFPSFELPDEVPAPQVNTDDARKRAATFMQRVNSYLHSKDQPPYVLNLDPAVMHLPFEANIDIRDTVDYAEVMKQCVGPPKPLAFVFFLLRD